jgi:hypothetical protein
VDDIVQCLPSFRIDLSQAGLVKQFVQRRALRCVPSNATSRKRPSCTLLPQLCWERRDGDEGEPRRRPALGCPAHDVGTQVHSLVSGRLDFATRNGRHWRGFCCYRPDVGVWEVDGS